MFQKWDVPSRIPELRTGETALRQQIDALDAQLADRDVYLTLADNLEDFLASLRNKAATATVAERQRVLRLLVKNVLVGPDKITIRHSIPVHHGPTSATGNSTDTDSEGETRPDCQLRWRSLVPAAGQHRPVDSRRAFPRQWEALGPEWTRAKHRRAGGPVMKLVRYADDFVMKVHGQQSDAEALWGEVTTVLQPMGLRLSAAKTRLTHIDDGFDFLGWHIQLRRKRGHKARKRYIYTYPSKKSLASIIDKVRQLTRRASHRILADLLRRLNPVIRGWCAYFQHGVSKRTFGYLDRFAFWRIVSWLNKRHLGLGMRTLVRRHLPGWRIRASGIEFFRAWQVPVTRYRYRGTRIPTPWASATS